MEKQVLVVDDDSRLSSIIVKILSRAGYSADSADTGASALGKAAGKPDVVLVLDQKLPDMTGYELITRLARSGQKNPFVVMTGQGDERLAVEMMKLGASDYLLKDVQLIDLLPGVLERLFHTLETDKRLAETEAMLRQRLAEKEILLREIHHRVKNNLTIISSLLNLQASSITSPDRALEAFEKSRDRILAMALVHEKLYESDNVTCIDILDYADNLMRQLLLAYSQSGRLKLEISGEHLELSLNQALPLGIILNELVTNSLKHAFPGQRSGTISLTIRSETEEQCCVVFSDDGIGFVPAENSTEGLGMTLVRLLIDQLGGALQTDSSAGSRFVLTFPHHSVTYCPDQEHSI